MRSAANKAGQAGRRGLRARLNATVHEALYYSIYSDQFLHAGADTTKNDQHCLNWTGEFRFMPFRPLQL